MHISHQIRVSLLKVHNYYLHSILNDPKMKNIKSIHSRTQKKSILIYIPTSIVKEQFMSPLNNIINLNIIHETSPKQSGKRNIPSLPEPEW